MQQSRGKNNPDHAYSLAMEGLVDISVLAESSAFIGSGSSTFGVFASHLSYAYGAGVPHYVDSADIANEKYKFLS